jgi:hypothetical protein
MFATISQGRGAFQTVAAGRYMYLAAGMVLPLVGFAVQQAARTDEWRIAVALVGCIALTGAGVDRLRDEARPDRARDLALKGQMLTAMAVSASEVTNSDRPDFTYNRGVRVSDLMALRDGGRLPAHRATAADLAYARLAMQVRVLHGRGAVVGGAVAAFPPGVSVVRDGACIEVNLHGQNALITRNTGEAVFSVSPSRSGVARAFVPYAGGNAGPRDIVLKARHRTTISEVLVGALVLQLPTGVNTLCGATWHP